MRRSTGFYDIEGEEIFENDVLQPLESWSIAEPSIKSIVIFKHGEWLLQSQWGITFRFNENDVKQMLKIGNIEDTPDILDDNYDDGGW